MSNAPGTVLPAYLSAAAALDAPSARQVVDLIRRYVTRWATPSPLGTDDLSNARLMASTTFNDGTFRSICYAPSISPRAGRAILAKRIKQLAFVPFFYRLNFIRQLSITHLAAQIEASHTRLAHCLGVTDCAAAMIESIEGKGHAFDDDEATAIIFFAFLHDCYHGPLGHTLDMMRDVFWGLMEDRVDKHLLAKALKYAVDKRSGPLWAATCVYIEPDNDRAHRLLKKVLAFHEAEADERFVATDIVDSAIDADRLDYLWRDAQHLVRPEASALHDWSVRVVEAACAVTVDGRPRLGFERSAMTHIEKLLEIRNEFYGAFYESPTKQVLEEMLIHAIYYVLPDDERTWTEIGSSVALLADDDLLSVLWQLAASPSRILSNVLLQEVFTNRPFSVIWKQGVPVADLESISLRYGPIKASLKKHKDELAKAVRGNVRLGLDDRSQEYKMVTAHFVDALVSTQTVDYAGDDELEIPPVPSEPLFWLQNLYGRGFRKKLSLEKILWRKVITEGTLAGRTAISQAIERLIENVVRTYYPPDDLIADTREARELREAAQRATLELREQLLTRPLIFISLSWIPNFRLSDLLAHSRGFGSDLRFPTSDSPEGSVAALRFRDRDEDYVAMVSAPDVLTKSPAGVTQIRDCFEDLLNRCGWLRAEDV